MNEKNHSGVLNTVQLFLFFSILKNLLQVEKAYFINTGFIMYTHIPMCKDYWDFLGDCEHLREPLCPYLEVRDKFYLLYIIAMSIKEKGIIHIQKQTHANIHMCLYICILYTYYSEQSKHTINVSSSFFLGWVLPDHSLCFCKAAFFSYRFWVEKRAQGSRVHFKECELTIWKLLIKVHYS